MPKTATGMSAPARNPLGLLLGATVISGLAGYVVTWLAFRFLGSAPYEQFAVFWSAFFLLAGAFSGVQQEYSRATSTRALMPKSQPKSARAGLFALATALVIMLVAFGSSPAWMPVVFQGPWVLWAMPFALGIAASIVMSATAGSLYGIGSWKIIAALIAGEGILRLAFIGLGLGAGWPLSGLAWLVVIPGPVSLVRLSRVLVRRLRGTTQLDVTYAGLSWNVSRTVLASFATGVLVSGFPVVLGATSHGEPATTLGDLIFMITLTRAPLIVTVMALQSFLVVQFRNRRHAATRLLLGISGTIGGVTVVASLLAFFAGAPVLDLVAGRVVVQDIGLVVLLVASSGIVAILQVTGAYLLADSHHAAYSTGLAVAAAATVGLLLTPLDLIARVELSLIVAPLIGLVTHAAFGLYLRLSRRQTR